MIGSWMNRNDREKKTWGKHDFEVNFNIDDRWSIEVRVDDEKWVLTWSLTGSFLLFLFIYLLYLWGFASSIADTPFNLFADMMNPCNQNITHVQPLAKAVALSDLRRQWTARRRLSAHPSGTGDSRHERSELVEWGERLWTVSCASNPLLGLTPLLLL